MGFSVMCVKDITCAGRTSHERQATLIASRCDAGTVGMIT